ncbi:MAG: hypothetical protein EOO73_13765 [Myxococcales bacterium]|nr:MAG: hypothetical protein EOO73_13765 [Myxococcales bacterium]
MFSYRTFRGLLFAITTLLALVVMPRVAHAVSATVLFTSPVPDGPSYFTTPVCKNCIYNSLPSKSLEWRMTSPGRYDILMQGLAPYTGFQDLFHVTALTNDSSRCAVREFRRHHTETLVQVQCAGPTGFPAAVRFMFSAQFMGPGVSTDKLGIARFMSGSFYPYSAYNSSGGTVSGLRDSVGVYSVMFAGLFVANGIPMVTTQSNAVHCNPYGQLSHPGGTIMLVACFNKAGVPTDGDFWLSFSNKNASALRPGGVYITVAQVETGAFNIELPVNQSHSGTSPNPISVRRVSTGNYTLSLPPLDGLTSVSAHVVATGATNSSCSVAFLTQATAQVVCTANGVPSDSAFAFQLY